jgi:flagellin-specific chaperone FliS
MTTPAKHTIDPTAVAPITLERVIIELRQLGTSDRLLALYELGLEGCANHDPNQVTPIVMELMSSLDYEYADIADGFRRVYEYCLQQASEGQLESVAFILQDLRDTLMRAITDSATTDAKAASA